MAPPCSAGRSGWIGVFCRGSSAVLSASSRCPLRSPVLAAAAMYLCRAASQALASRLSRAPSAASRLKHRAPLRQMSSGSVPGSSGESMFYYLLTGVAAFGGLFYAYRVVSSSRSNYIEHVNILHERSQGRKDKH